MADDKTMRAHNFLKMNSACSPGKRWARKLKKPTDPKVLELVDAWNQCEGPFWLIWALFWANRQDKRVPIAKESVRALLVDPLKNLSNAGNAFNKQSAAAYATFLKYPGDQTVMDNALTQANQGVILAACGTMPGQGRVTREARASLALVHAINSNHPRNDLDLGAIIEAADRAHAFAIEAWNTDAASGKTDKDACKKARSDLAKSMRVDSKWLDLTNADVKAALKDLDTKSADAPPWAHDTEPDSGFAAGISSPTASPWYASIKGGTVWYVFGTDGQDTVVARTASVQDNVTSATTAGSPIAPSAGNDWGFSFPSLTSGDSVSLNVTITYPNPTAPDVLLQTYTIG
jgi:hypothetical protein